MSVSCVWNISRPDSSTVAWIVEDLAFRVARSAFTYTEKCEQELASPSFRKLTFTIDEIESKIDEPMGEDREL